MAPMKVTKSIELQWQWGAVGLRAGDGPRLVRTGDACWGGGCARCSKDEETDGGDEHGDGGHDRRNRELRRNQSEHLPQKPTLHPPVALRHGIAVREVVHFVVEAGVLGGPGLRAGARAIEREGTESRCNPHAMAMPRGARACSPGTWYDGGEAIAMMTSADARV